jgi:hypothetical protein
MNRKIQEIEDTIEELQSQVDELKIEASKKENGKIERVLNQEYWFITNLLSVVVDTEAFWIEDNNRFKVGNYYLSKEEAQKIADKRKLSSLLEKFSKENGGNKSDWDDENAPKFAIAYCHSDNALEISSRYLIEYEGATSFISEEIAKQAIEKYKDLILKVMGRKEIEK